MRILVLQFAPDTRGRRLPRFEPQLGTLLALLRKRGHEPALCGLARFDEAGLKNALARHLPQLIYADISAVCVDAARRALQYVAGHEFVPVVAGGQFPTVDPESSLSLPHVQAIAVGEPDASLVTYLERMKDPTVGQVVSGVWLRDEKGLARPDLPHLVEELDSLPFAEREMFDYGSWIRETGQIEVAIGRGCPQQCAYCVNERVESMYEGAGTWVRRRSPANILAEIEQVRGRYEGVQSVRFLDHSYALSREWLETFLEAYAQRCKLPFRCHVRANACEPRMAETLARGGCYMADVEVISGSDFLRNEIFDMQLSEEQIVQTFADLRSADIRTRAIVYLGAPYESEPSMDETAALLKRIRPDTVDVRPFFPWPGTRARETANESGWLHPRGEDQYHHDRVGVNMPACRPELVEKFMRRLRQEHAVEHGDPWWRRWAGPLFRRT